MGRWVVEAACEQLVTWASDTVLAKLSVSVNISTVQFMQRDFVSELQNVIEEKGTQANRLRLELTESVLVDDFHDVVKKMSALKKMGVTFSLDDFGTGYSSLAYLKQLPLDELKIDGSFVKDLETDQNDAVIAKTIVALGHNLGLKVIAEGVENEAQRVFLENVSCDAFQGYLFSKPLPVEEFVDFCKRA
ncbi:EAL domain-containing protein [Teredinibacter haidensis]|uniref:EAL domain-containing protein n=1 Tax=Teredinibacter haidensis TaxID=2731755 RepID=UPI000A9692B8|nr:EAL domain-containing protein [Teredinibacter haidensis]